MCSKLCFTSRTSLIFLANACMICLAISACGQRQPPADNATPGPATHEQAAKRQIASNPLREAYFGETHLHTAYSLDAYIGGTRLTPDDAYQFAKGEAMQVSGRTLRISEPLDFAAVTDHAEYLGEMYSTLNEDAQGHDQKLLQQLRNLTSIAEKEAWFMQYVVKSNRSATPRHPPFFVGPETTKSAWQVILDAAERHNEPGTFTTLPAFEWSGAPNGANLHRNVFFRDSKVPDLPVSYFDVNREDGVWQWMAGLEKQGMQVFAVPHNSNASKQMMFAPDNAAGEPIDRDYAELRARFEPLIEMMQIKGNSEVNRKFWSADEFADFENADSTADYSGREPQRENYVRYGLIKGLEYQQSLGANPYQYGIVGGSDNHNGAPGNVKEDNWEVGSHGDADATVERRRTAAVGGWLAGKDLNPGTLTGVWAVSNTRGAIWDAMKNRETFATSGPRIKLRLFAGFGLPATAEDPLQLVEQGYAKGVPMGQTLSAAGRSTANKPLRFTLWAAKDVNDANLDRIQLIKGWVDDEGNLHEKIINVAWSGKRTPDTNGKLPSVGNSVDLKTATYSNDIGSAQLIGAWVDEEFDASRDAIYYARILQIPTPRWSTYDAVRASLPLLDDVSATVQERAWSSPIWYTP